jgi:L-ascorbate metabolism protein UlaG (beta-lactamase superfamily)
MQAFAKIKALRKPSRRASMKTKLFLAIAILAASAPGLHAEFLKQTQTFKTSAGDVNITPIYHASTMIEAGGKVIYVDPAKPSDFTGLPPADLILISDIHGDHMDADAVKKLSKADTEIIAPPSVVMTITNAKPLANGEKTKWGKWNIEAIPMYNMVRKNPQGEAFHTKGRGDGFILTYGGKRFYFSGDTEAIPEMLALKNIDVAFICMFERPTMSPDEAADAVLKFRPKVVIPYHYGPPPNGSDPKIFAQKLQGSGIDVRLLNWYANKAS